MTGFLVKSPDIAVNIALGQLTGIDSEGEGGTSREEIRMQVYSDLFSASAPCFAFLLPPPPSKMALTKILFSDFLNMIFKPI